MYTKLNILKKIKTHFGLSRYPATNYTPPKAKHDPIRLSEIKQRIVISVDRDLSKNGFQCVGNNLEIWVRKRTEDIFDLISLLFDPRPSQGCIRVLVNIGYHAPQVEKYFLELADKSYDLSSSTDGGYCYQLNPKETKAEWMFWDIAFEESEINDLVHHINTFGIPFLEKVSNHEELIKFIERRQGPFDIRRAILYQLIGNKGKGLEILESGRRRDLKEYADRLDEIKKTPLWVIREKLLSDMGP